MSKHVEVKKEQHLSIAPQAPSTAIMSSHEEIFSVARIIQAMSKPESTENPSGPDFVKGDVVVYPQRYKIGDLKTPFSVIFLRNTLEWANFEVVAQKEEWRSEENRIDKDERAGGNEHWPFEYEKDGKKMRRYRQVTLYVLLPHQVEAFLKDVSSDSPTMVGSIKPIAIKFKNYNRRAAQQLLDCVAGPEFVVKNEFRAQMGKPPIQVYDYEHIFKVENKTNAKGTFQILSYVSAGPVKNPEVKKMAQMAHAAIAKQNKLKTITLEETEFSASEKDTTDLL